jgi:hypothetical protein
MSKDLGLTSIKKDISPNLKLWQALSKVNKRAIKSLKQQGYTFKESYEYIKKN